MHNSAENMLIELEIGVAYSSKVDEVINVIRKAVETVDGVSEEKSPAIGVDNFGDSSINFGIRVWAPAVRHFEVRYALNQAIFNALQQHDIEIPFPQRGSQDARPIRVCFAFIKCRIRHLLFGIFLLQLRDF